MRERRGGEDEIKSPRSTYIDALRFYSASPAALDTRAMFGQRGAKRFRDEFPPFNTRRVALARRLAAFL